MNKSDISANLFVDHLVNDLHKHFHEELSVTIIYEGGCRLWVNGVLYPLERGDIVIVPQKMVHACIPSPDSTPAYRVLFINMEQVEKFCTESNFRFDLNSFYIVKSHYPEDEALFKVSSESDEFDSVSDYSSVESILKTAINSEKLPVNSSPEDESQAMRAVASYIRSRWEKAVTLEELSDVSGLSRYHLVNKFRKESGITPHAFWTNIRINKARELLKNDIPISEIALELGFYDQSHFSNTFIRYTGITPLQYRKKIRNSNFFQDRTSEQML